MKKILIILFICILGTTMLIGCGDEQQKENLLAEIETLKAEISNLQKEKESLSDEIIHTKIEEGTAKYVLTLEVKQTHYSFDIEEMFKDEMNKMEFEIPVDKEYYDTVSIGDTLADEFRMGSFVLYGSFGAWDVTITNKEIR